MTENIDTNETQEVIWAMRKYGGHFVTKLADAICYADTNNTGRIKKAFPKYWEQYHKIGREAREFEVAHLGSYRCRQCNRVFDDGDLTNCPQCGSTNFYCMDGRLP
jgi:rubrerythrin